MFTPNLMSYVTCKVSHAMCHVSHVTCHGQLVPFFLLLFYKVVDLIGGGSVINGAFPIQFIEQLIPLDSRVRCDLFDPKVGCLAYTKSGEIICSTFWQSKCTRYLARPLLRFIKVYFGPKLELSPYKFIKIISQASPPLMFGLVL